MESIDLTMGQQQSSNKNQIEEASIVSTPSRSRKAAPSVRKIKLSNTCSAQLENGGTKLTIRNSPATCATYGIERTVVLNAVGLIMLRQSWNSILHTMAMNEQNGLILEKNLDEHCLTNRLSFTKLLVESENEVVFM